MQDKPNKKRGLSRRGFVAAGTLAAVPLAGRPAQAHEPVLFSERHVELAAALADAVVPPDEHSPGAGEAGFVTYIDRQLKGPLERMNPLYRLGLPALDQTARRIAGKGFLEMADDERNRLLAAIEEGRGEGPEWPDFSAQLFFRRVIEHVMQSFYGSPEHGGNREMASWKMLGIVDVMH